MKQDIHPKYFPKAVATCACGAKHVVGSTREAIEVEICGSCHPFFTGQEKILDTAGRVDKFKKRAAKASAEPKKKVTKIAKSAARKAKKK